MLNLGCFQTGDFAWWADFLQSYPLGLSSFCSSDFCEGFLFLYFSYAPFPPSQLVCSELWDIKQHANSGPDLDHIACIFITANTIDNVQIPCIILWLPVFHSGSYMYNPHTETLAYKYNGQAKQAGWFIVRKKNILLFLIKGTHPHSILIQASLCSHGAPPSPVYLLLWILKCLASALWSSNYLQEPYSEIGTNWTQSEVPGSFLCAGSRHPESLNLLEMGVHISSDLEKGEKIYSEFSFCFWLRITFILFLKFYWSIDYLQYCVPGV